MKKYQIIYADPPWGYRQTQHSGANGSYDTSSSRRHYEVVVDSKIVDKFTDYVKSVADENCLLFMWSSSPHLDVAMKLGKNWGFKYSTIGFVWDKQRVNPGFYTMSQCEICLIFKKGNIPQPRGARNVRQLVSELRGEHSVKPNEVRKRIELMFPTQSKMEMFARTTTDGMYLVTKLINTNNIIRAGSILSHVVNVPYNADEAFSCINLPVTCRISGYNVSLYRSLRRRFF